MVNDEKNWYAIFVPTTQEDSVKKRLEVNLGETFRFLIPKRTLRERKQGVWFQTTRTLFPGYILLQGLIDVDTYRKIKLTDGVIKILENEGEPLIIKHEEIEVISRLTKNDDIINASNVFIEGSKIQVIDGPLLGCEGLIEGINKRKGRVKVRLTLFGDKRVVELSINVVETV